MMPVVKRFKRVIPLFLFVLIIGMLLFTLSSNWIGVSKEIKGQILSLIEEKYGHQVELKELEIAGLNKLVFKEVKLNEKQNYNLSINRIEVSYDSLDLLLQRTDVINSIRKVKVLTPKIKVNQNKLAKENTKKQMELQNRLINNLKEQLNAFALPDDFKIDLLINDGILISDINDKIKSFKEINGDFKFAQGKLHGDLRARISGDKKNQIDISLNTNLQKFDLDINLDELNINLLANELQSFLQGTEIKISQGLINGGINFKGDLNFASADDFNYKAKLNLRQGTFQHNKFSREIQIEDSEIIIKPEVVSVENLIANVGKSKLNLNGVIKDWQDPKLYLNYNSSQLALSILEAWLPSGLNIRGQAAINGNLRGSINNPTVKTQFTLPNGEVNSYQIKNMQFGLNYKDKFININDLQAELADGRIKGQGTISWAKNDQTLYTASLDLKQVNLEELEANNIDLAGELNGNLIISGENALTDLSLFGNAQIYNGEWQGYKFNNLNSNFWFNEQQLVLSDLIMEAGKSKWEASGIINTDKNLNLDIIAKDVALSKLTGLHNYQTLKGTANLQGALRGKLDSPKFAGDITIDNLSYQGRKFREVTGEVNYDAKMIGLKNVILKNQSTEYKLDGDIILADQLGFDFDLNTKAGNLKSLYKLITNQKLKGINSKFNGKVKISGESTNIKAEGDLELLEGRIRDFDLESGLLDFIWQDNELQVKKVQIKSSTTEVFGYGKIINNKEINLNVIGKGIDLAKIDLAKVDMDNKYLKNIEGSLDFAGQIRGNLLKPNVMGKVNLNQAMIGGHRFQRVEGNIEYAESIVSLKKLRINEKETEYELNGQIDLQGKEFSDFRVQMFDGRIAELLELLPLGIDYKIPHSFFGGVNINGEFMAPKINGKILLQDIDKEGYLTIEGSYRFDDGANLNLDANKFSLAPFNKFIPLEQRLAGSLNTQANLKGKLTELEIVSDIKIKGGYIGNLNYDSLTGGLVLENGNQLKVTKQLELLINNQNLITIDGYFPIWSKYDSLYIDVNLKQGDLSLLSSWLKDYKVVNGKSSGVLTIFGSRNKPYFTGQVEARAKELSADILPAKFNDLNMVLNIEEQKINIKQLNGRYGGGKFSTIGKIAIDNWNLGDININFDGKSIPISHGSWQGKNDADLKVEGTLQQPLITGDVLAYNTKILIPFKWPTGSSSSQPSIRPRFELRIKPGEDVKVYNDNIDILVEQGELQLVTAENGLELNGTLRSKTGSFNYYNTDFELQSGVANFDNYKRYIPDLNLIAQTEIMNLTQLQGEDIKNSIESDEIEVTLRLNGPANQMRVDFESDPSLSRKEIIDLLASRGGLGSLLDEDYEQIIQKELWRMLETGIRVELFSSIEETLESKWDLDEVKIYSGLGSNWKFKMGKYLTDELFIKYDYVFNEENERSIGFEYQMIDGLKDIILDGSMNNQNEYRLEVEANFPFN